ncbi:hypothetical protein QQF64_028095 [Cirrhinus molitorella]|uniref:Secreted protein n=1 Tax=Cirrhinus molitorella TaxID=172907 RepID=A0ABR3N5R1_9TELE
MGNILCVKGGGVLLARSLSGPLWVCEMQLIWMVLHQCWCVAGVVEFLQVQSRHLHSYCELAIIHRPSAHVTPSLDTSHPRGL